MKEYLKIGEISKLYNIGVDSIRYYENLGLLTPKRSESGYRLYSIDDLWKLNIISDLRKMEFPVKKIGVYLKNQTIETTKEILKEELKIAQNNINYYENLKKILNDRIEDINLCETAIDFQISKKNIENRKISLIKGYFQTDGQVDMTFRKIQNKIHEQYMLFGNKDIGACIHSKTSEKSLAYQYVFMLLDDSFENFDKVIPKGKYICIFYKGNYENGIIAIEKIKSYCNKNRLEIIGDFFEIYKIDIHETSIEDEFLTEIQVQIKEIES